MFMVYALMTDLTSLNTILGIINHLTMVMATHYLTLCNANVHKTSPQNQTTSLRMFPENKKEQLMEKKEKKNTICKKGKN